MQEYLCYHCLQSVEYVCPSCIKPIFPVDISKLVIDNKSIVNIDKQGKYYYCNRCRETGTIKQSLIKEEDLEKLKNAPENSIPELTMHLIIINSKPSFLITVK